ncbi:MAG: hypothetical protein QOD06_3313 [Candidatus Binatota bacterium]|jgi:hypothetical protein|nr:hypothetical protein [Candidatus Binatota bacterium]
MKRRWWATATMVAFAFSGVAAARDLEEILKDKGILTDEEAKEVKRSAAAEPSPAASAAAALPEWLAKVTPFGDVRVRNESFFRKDDPDRVRQRFRLRFGAKVKVNDETELGFRLATGQTGELISNNQTLTDTFTFKDFNVSNAYLKVAPAKSLGWSRPWLTLTAGKFDVPLYNPPTITGLVFDRDLTPEGGAETIKLIEEKEGLVRGAGLNFGQWVFKESSKTGDGAIFAFQGFANLAPGDRLLWNVGAGDYLFQKESTIAQARNSNTSMVTTNSVVLSDGTVVGGRPIDPAKEGTDENGEPLAIIGYAGGFNVVNAGTDLTYDTGVPAWPVRGFVDFAHNTDAVTGEDTGYELGGEVGSAKEPLDLLFRYAWEHLETDAVVSAFSESDYGADGGTNTEGHILQASVVLLKNLTLLSTAYFTEPIDEVEGRSTDTSTRWQVDLIGKF